MERGNYPEQSFAPNCNFVAFTLFVLACLKFRQVLRDSSGLGEYVFRKVGQTGEVQTYRAVRGSTKLKGERKTIVFEIVRGTIDDPAQRIQHRSVLGERCQGHTCIGMSCRNSSYYDASFARTDVSYAQ